MTIERERDPQYRLIPDDIWRRYFADEYRIEEKVSWMAKTENPERVFEDIRDVYGDNSDIYYNLPGYKNRLLAALVFCHSHLSLDRFKNMFRSMYIKCNTIFRMLESNTISKDVIEILAASKNNEYLKYALTYVKDQELLALAFRCMAKNGHLDFLKYLEEKVIPKERLQDMITADNYAAFHAAAENCHVDVLKYLTEKAPNDFRAMLQDNYAAFCFAATYGHLDFLKYLEENKIPKERLQDVIKADNYAAFRRAAENCHLGVLQHLVDIAPHDLQAMIKEDNYSSWRYAANNGHANVLNFLMHYSFMRNESFKILSMCRLDDLFIKSAPSNIQELLKHPAIFEHACSHNPNEIKPFITEQLKELKTRKMHGNPLHILHNKQEAECLFYLLHHLIERVGTAAKDDILFLLNIPELQAILPIRMPPHDTTNLALRAAIIQKSCARNAASWDEIIGALYAISAVRTQAERDGHYPNETQDSLDLRAIAANTESFMQALTAEENSQLKQLQKHYKPQIQKLDAIRPGMAWKNVINCFENYSAAHPATFTNTKGEIITLPLEWDDFKKLELSKEDHNLALKAYYQNPAHAAYRLFLKPNPWIANNVSFVEVFFDSSSRGDDYSSLKDIITLLNFAAFDENMPPPESSGLNLEDRITTFCESIALITRAHNWDKKRASTDADSNHILVQYDDLEGDKPSFFPKIKKRLMQSLVAHPLFIPIDAIAAEAVNIASAKNVAEQMTYDNLPDWYQELTQKEQNHQQHTPSATAALQGLFASSQHSVKFKNSDERKLHPLGKLIPDYFWHLYFSDEIIDENILDIMTTKPEKLLEKIMSLNVYHCAPEYKNKMLTALICSHSNLSFDTFNNIFRSMYIKYNTIFRMIESNTISRGVIIILVYTRNTEYLKCALTYVKDQELLSLAFLDAAQCGYIDVLKYLEAKAPNDLQAMIKANAYSLSKDGYRAFIEAATYGHIEVLQYLERKVVPKKNLQDMIKADNYAAFRNAAENGHLDVVKNLVDIAEPNDFLQDMIQETYADSMRDILRNGHANVLNFLMHYDFVRDRIHYCIVNEWSLSPMLQCSSIADIKDLLKHPAIFEHACLHNRDAIEPFITEQRRQQNNHAATAAASSFFQQPPLANAGGVVEPRPTH